MASEIVHEEKTFLPLYFGFMYGKFSILLCFVKLSLFWYSILSFHETVSAIDVLLCPHEQIKDL